MKRMARFFFVVLSGWSTGFSALAQPAADEGEVLQPGLHYAPVVVDGRELFVVRGVQIFRADARARLIADRIIQLARDPGFTTNDMAMVEEAEQVRIIGRDAPIVTVVDGDAQLIGLKRGLAAQLVFARVGEAITQFRAEREVRFLAVASGLALINVLAAWLVLWVLFRLYRRLNAMVRSRVMARLEKTMKIQSFSLVQSDHLWRAYKGLMDAARLVAVVFVLYIFLQRMLNLFPWTRRAGVALFDVLVHPLESLVLGLVESLPDVVFLFVLYLVVRYVLKVVLAFFEGIERGAVRLGGFESEWAMPTYRILRLFIVLFAMVIAYPYIPGSSTDAFKGISVFMGVILSLGSSSLISNIIAGYSMTYRKAFRVGDRIRVGDHMGDVEEVRMMVTHLRTLKNEEVVIPNSSILNREVVNYSSLARKEGLILHTTVGIGYEVPWRQVEAMLQEAAARTPGIEKDPAPFIRQTALADFAVTYELNVICRDPKGAPQIHTDLHRSIQDVFNTYGVQIMTPAYEGDPEQPKVVPPSQWYAAPAVGQGTPEPAKGDR